MIGGIFRVKNRIELKKYVFNKNRSYTIWKNIKILS